MTPTIPRHGKGKSPYTNPCREFVATRILANLSVSSELSIDSFEAPELLDNQYGRTRYGKSKPESKTQDTAASVRQPPSRETAEIDATSPESITLPDREKPRKDPKELIKERKPQNVTYALVPSPTSNEVNINANCSAIKYEERRDPGELIVAQKPESTAQSTTQAPNSSQEVSGCYWSSSFEELQLYFGILACRAWRLSHNLRRKFSRVLSLASKIDGFALRLGNMGAFSLLLHYETKCCTSDLTIAQQHCAQIATWCLRDCLEAFRPFHEFCRAYNCNEASMYYKYEPQIEVRSYSHSGLDSSDIGYAAFDKALACAERSILICISFTRRVLARNVLSDGNLNAQTFIKKMSSPFSPEHGWKFMPITRRTHYEITLIYQQSGKTKSCQERHLPQNIERDIVGMKVQAIPLFIGLEDIQIPVFASLAGWNFQGDKVEQLYKMAFSMVSSNASLAPKTLIPQSEISGRLVLHGTLLVSRQLARPKKKEVLLFENLLAFRRRKGDRAIVLELVSLESLLIVTCRHLEAGSGVISVYWDELHYGHHDVANVDFFFDDMDLFAMWAGFLALAQKRTFRVSGMERSAEAP